MKKKTLAAASLLLALLMPLGATPLAVYAEGEDGAQTGISAVSEDPEGTGETNTAKTVNAPSTLNVGQIHVTNSNANFDETYTDLGEAVKAAPSGSTIELSAGTYSLYTYSANPAALNDPSISSTNPEWKQYIAGKSLTFVGHSTDDTFWNIGTPYYNAEGEKNGDYSFDGADVITFRNLTLRSPVQYDGTVLSSQKNYTGFIRPNETIVENCVVKGRTAYWGYNSATFTDTTFNAPSGDYAIWTYCSPVMTFDNCTFNASGKVINVYTDYSAGKHDITVNFNNCTVNSTAFLGDSDKPAKSALNINDYNMGGHKYILNITKANVTAARDNKFTCSQVFGFGEKDGNNTGRTDVNLDGELVFSAGRKLTHSYTDGEHDNAYTFTYTGDWSGWKPTEGDEHLLYRTRPRKKTCNYCGYPETAPEEREEKREYLLHYDLNGGTGAEGVYSDRYYFAPTGGNTATVAAAPSRAGYQFAGWQDKDGEWYAAGDTVTVNHDITLTAQWNKLVTVSFDLCGHGGANISSQTFVSGNKASEPTAPKEDGWVFGGWYTEKGCKYRFSFDSAVTSDITLYAKWDRVTTVVSAPVATPTPSPAPAAAATKTATVKNSAIPQTSDAFPMEGLLALLAVGAVGFGAAGWLRKKHH